MKKKSRKFLILVAILATVVVIFNSCRAQQQAVEEREEPFQKLQPKNLEPWYQDDDPDLKVGDPIIFYNEFLIKVRGKIPRVGKILEDGSFIRDNNSININLPVEAHTAGEIAYVEPGVNGPIAITVAFKKNGIKKEQIIEKPKRELNEIEEFDDVEKKETSISNQSEKIEDNPLNYWRVFKVLPDKTFTLDEGVKIFVEGKSWDAKARIDGEGSGYCLLLVDKKDRNNQKNVGGPAPGVGPVKGKKIIKKN